MLRIWNPVFGAEARLVRRPSLYHGTDRASDLGDPGLTPRAMICRPFGAQTRVTLRVLSVLWCARISLADLMNCDVFIL